MSICDVDAVDPVAGGAELWGRKGRNRTTSFLQSPFIILCMVYLVHVVLLSL